MKVRIKKLGYSCVDTKVEDIVEAQDYNKIGYQCLCSYGGKKDWLFFGYDEVELVEEDRIVESVINQFKQRSEVGIAKYGTTLDRNDLSTYEWIEHAKQEAMDFILYLEKLKHELKEVENMHNELLKQLGK
jgi:hypothetical protein